MEQRKLSEKSKRLIMMFGDAVMIPFALWLAVVLRYGDLYKDVSVFWWLFPITSIVGVFALQKFGLYRAVVRYIGPSAMVPVLQGVTAMTVALSLAAYLTQAISFPRSAPIIFWFMANLLVGGSRIIVRAYFYGIRNNYLSREPVAIYGAGDTGAQLAMALVNGSSLMPVAFIDDDRTLRKSTIHGIRVYDSAHVDRLVEDFGIKQVLLAIPSASAEVRARILNDLSTLPVQIRTIPSLSQFIDGHINLTDIREIEIGDLLGRETVPPDESLLKASVKGKSVLVTGAGGTIGSELCRKILKLGPKRLILYDNSEYALYTVESELRGSVPASTELVALLGSIMNFGHLKLVMNKFDVQTVYHAAAFKHVPMVERNVLEGVRNNVVGTWNVAQAAALNNIEEFVLISSDKAVRPTNVMGATKRLAELIVQAHAAKYEKTIFCMVRFGNVLKSSGSVVPMFEQQIQAGGPVTVTHRDATRFFMTASEAAELVLQAGALARGGDLFVLDMGEPVKIYDLAVKMIHLHGKEVMLTTDHQSDSGQQVAVQIVGLRPGEKLYEELVIGQNIVGTKHPKIMMATEEKLEWEIVADMCDLLKQASEAADYQTIKDTLERYVSGYRMHDTRVDPFFTVTTPQPINSKIRTLYKADE